MSLARAFVAAGFQAIVATFDPRSLDAPLAVETGEVVVRDGFVYCDILPAAASAAMSA